MVMFLAKNRLNKQVQEYYYRLRGEPQHAKAETHSGAKKRFKLTKNGKIKRMHAYKSHILNKKTRKRRGLRRATICRCHQCLRDQASAPL